MDTRTSGASESALALPKGGGALSALGDKFKVDLNSGGGAFGVAFDLPEGRGGLTPALGLQYSTGSGNGPFGLGWRLGVGDVARKTSAGLPAYDDGDTFVFAGADDLVPVGGELFRPRVDGLHARIRRTAAPDGRPCFVVTTRDGVRHSFGSTAASRLDHPDLDVTFRWLATESVEPNGSRIRYAWRHEDAGHRQAYLDNVEYVDYDDGGTETFLFRVRFDYGDLDEDGTAVRPWPVRPDPFSTWAAGFEIRTLRLCRRVLLEVRAPGTGSYTVVRSWELEHQTSDPDGISLLTRVTHTGHRRDGAAVERERHPPISFGYSRGALDRPRLVALRSEDGFLPDTLANPRVDLVDLTGNGLPDLVDRSASTPLWWENRGGGVFGRPRRLDLLPAEAGRAGVSALLADMDGSGSADLYLQDGPRATYWRNRFLGGFDEPVHLDAAPGLRVPGVAYLPMELNGDGAIDLLALAEDRRLYWHASEPGRGGAPRRSFAPAAPVRFEPEGGSRLPATAPARLRLAGMTGDGSMAIVELASGRISYRPYLGGGRFGAEVVMANAPVWQRGLDPRAVFLADVTGSGCADVVVLDGRHVLVAVNQSGNAFAPLRSIAHLAPVDLDAIRVADLLGSGTAGILLALDGAQGSTRHRFLDVSGGSRPLLLDRIDNGFGGLVTITYGTSPAEWLRDDAAGQRPRLTLPAPVPVVKSVATEDVLSGAQARVEYRYHDGFYDATEREFRGFGMVEETESGDASAAGVLRRTWFHPGARRDHAGRAVEPGPGAGAPSALLREPVTLPAAVAPGTPEEASAVRALKGMQLRTEVYAVDAGGPTGPPLVVQESAYDVVAVAAPAPGVYSPRLRESVTAKDEGDGDVRKLVRTEIDYDGYGNPLTRRTSGGPETAGGGLPSVPTIEETRRFHVRDDPEPAPDLTAPYQVSYQVDRAYELVVEEVDGANRKLLSHRRTYFDGPDFEGQPLQTLPVRGNPVRVEDLALTDALVAAAWGAEVPEAALVATGFVPEGAAGTRRWWRQSERRALDARGLVRALRDPVGGEHRVEHDAAAWKVLSATDAAGIQERAEIDYQALDVSLHVDGNLRQTAYRHTPLGRLRALVRRGRPDAQGSFPGDTAAAPTVGFTYDLTPVDPAAPQPVSTEISNRIETRGTEVVRTVEYSAGFGELLQKRIEQRPGEVEGSAGLSEAWIVSGLEEKGARAFPHVMHAPTVDDQAAWRVTQAMRDAPAGRVFHDALGRPVRSVAPDGSERRVVHGTWKTMLHDENDRAGATLDPSDPGDAALLARLAPQIDTPQVHVFDAYERLCEVVEDLGGGTSQRTTYVHDAVGRPVEIRDAAGRVAVRATYDYTGHVIAWTQIDTGTHRFVYDALGALILRVDARGVRLRTTHAPGARVREIFELPRGGTAAAAWASPARRLVVRYTYGSASDAAALTANAVGLPAQVLDPAGRVDLTYDGRGRKASATRRFFQADPAAEVDPAWTPAGADARPLEAQSYRVDYEHDATGALRRVVYPAAGGGARASVRLERTTLGLLRRAVYESGTGAQTEVISGTRYDARLRRVAVEHGNGLTTDYEYGADDPRLQSLVVAAEGAAEPLYSLAYSYDPVGNPLSVRREDGAALRALAADGRQGVEVSAYDYDALHRLTGAGVFDSLAGARQQRDRVYAYDAPGNHTALGDRPGPAPRYAAGTNRLMGFAGGPDALSYDAGGSMTSTPSLPAIAWDERGHLAYLEHASGTRARYSYDYLGNRVRKLVRDGGEVSDVRSIDGIFEVERVTSGGAVTGERARAHVLGQLEVAALAVSDLGAGTEDVVFLHGDHLTSVLCATDSTGAPVRQADYLPYGLVAAAAGGAGGHGFTGAVLDPESGLVHMSSRYYDPALARFLSPDPMLVKYLDGRNAGGVYRPSNLNPYAYAAGNPLVYYDPTGNFIFLALIVAGVGLLVAGIGYAMQQSSDPTVRGFGKAFEIIGLVAAGIALGAIGGAFIAGVGSFIFGGATLGAAFAGTIGATTFGALTTAAITGAVIGGVIGGVHGAITGAYGAYDLGSPTGYLAFIADTTWGLSQTAIGVIGITVVAIGGGSVNRGLTERSNVVAVEAGWGGGGISLGPFIIAGGTFASDPELFRHESIHTMQNRIFGPIFTFTVIPLTIISNIMTAIGPPGSNPGFVNAGEPPNWDNWINPWEAWAEAAV